jgi:excisionase family DNA binding protein
MSEATSPKFADLMTRAEAARYLRISPLTLMRWTVHHKHDIPYLRVGGRVLYRREDLDLFLQRNRHG